MVYRKGGFFLGFSGDKKRIVLIQRSDCRVWYLPGGGFEGRESKEHAVMREFEEETGFYFNLQGF